MSIFMLFDAVSDTCTFVSHRTLLALGCHVGMGDEKAEENLKKIKLPKTYGDKHNSHSTLYISI